MIACTLNGITFTNFNEVDINESDEVICKINEKFSYKITFIVYKIIRILNIKNV